LTSTEGATRVEVELEMSSGIKKKIELEIVHVLFIDIVGYTKLLTNEQHALVEQLNQVVRSSSEFQRAEAADRLIKIPTGDGMALIFYKSPEQPVECALEIHRALKTHPELHVRMGVHSGPVSAVIDVNERANTAGMGINIAQRVMDCGDAGHILLSKRVAEDLEQYGHWQPQLHDLGEAEVKHGVHVHVFNLYNEELGNPEMPEKLRQGKAKEQSVSEIADAPARQDEGFWMAVLPFKHGGANAELVALADGLTEEIVTSLSRFPYLKVISRSSTSCYGKKSADVRTIGKRLGARYIIEGSLRQAGSKLRIAVQLVDASSGAHLWAETFDRNLSDGDVFEMQDDLASRIVAIVGDPSGVLVRSMALAVRDAPLAEMGAAELVLRFFAYWQQIRPDEHARLRTALEEKLEREPAHALAWACLSRLYLHEHQHRMNLLPESVERARRSARRAVEIDSTCQMGWETLAEASYFAFDLGTFRTAGERAMSLNPLNTSTAAIVATLIAFGGEWDRGVEITRGAMSLNPHHPGWYHFTLFYDQFRKREYEKALETTKRINMPEFVWTHFTTAAVCGRLGRREEARRAVAALRSVMPDYREGLRPHLKLWILDADVVEETMKGLAEAEALTGEGSGLS
jgi:TolB-like protein/class 3 adenylate cyclase